jgi:hypothetical protein
MRWGTGYDPPARPGSRRARLLEVDAVTSAASKTYKVGRDSFARQVSLTCEMRSNGHRKWTLHREASSQRDESIIVYDLSDSILIEIGKAACHERYQAARQRGCSEPCFDYGDPISCLCTRHDKIVSGP